MSANQSQSAFGGICGCGICTSHLGCPNPVPVGATFPLLEGVIGSDWQQKEELQELLKESTTRIMKEFYFLVSMFFMSLKQRVISVQDMKTHLMVLNAYSGSSSKWQQSLFQDQLEELKGASTMNAIFDVLQGFCSFINYDLIEYLIDLVGTREDKERLKVYKDRFAEYAKRRIYECPSELATSVVGQCDVYVKVESRFENFSLHELCAFRKNISDLLELSRYAIRLCCIEKGCIKLTFQIPNFVQDRIFPLRSQQKRELTKLGIRQLTTSGNIVYELFQVCFFSSSISHEFIYYI